MVVYKTVILKTTIMASVRQDWMQKMGEEWDFIHSLPIFCFCQCSGTGLSGHYIPLYDRRSRLRHRTAVNTESDGMTGQDKRYLCPEGENNKADLIYY